MLPAVGLAQTGTLAANSRTYLASGGTVIFTVSMDYTGIPLFVLGTHIDLPAGWSYVSTDLGGSGLTAMVSPVFGDTGAAEWAFTSFPAVSATFHYELTYAAAGLSGPQTISGNFILDGDTTVPFSAPVVLTPAAIPEPATSALLAGLFGPGLVCWFQSRKRCRVG